MHRRIVNIVVNSFENDARVYRTAQIGKNFAEEVFVLALHENGLKKYEEQEGVKIRRFKLLTRGLPKSKVFQFIKFFEFNLRVFWFILTNKAYIIHAHDLSALLVGYLGKLFKGSKLIYDSHELFLSRSMKVPFIRYGLVVEKFIAKRCDEVITVSESIVDVLEKHFELDEKPVLLRNVPNYLPVINRSEGKLRKFLKLKEEDFVIIYQGGVQLDRGIELLLQAVDSLKHLNIYLIVLGNGSLKEKLLNSAKINDQKGIIFLDAVPHKDLHYWTSDANVGVSPIVGKSLSYKYCLPNKLFEYIRAGLPVIVSDLPDMKSLVEKHNVGISFMERDVNDLTEKISLLYHDDQLRCSYSRNSIEAAKILNWEEESKVLTTVYQKLIKI